MGIWPVHIPTGETWATRLEQTVGQTHWSTGPLMEACCTLPKNVARWALHRNHYKMVISPLYGMDPNLRANITPYQAFNKNLGKRHTLVYSSSNPLRWKKLNCIPKYYMVAATELKAMDQRLRSQEPNAMSQSQSLKSKAKSQKPWTKG